MADAVGRPSNLDDRDKRYGYTEVLEMDLRTWRERANNASRHLAAWENLLGSLLNTTDPAVAAERLRERIAALEDHIVSLNGDIEIAVSEGYRRR